MRGGGKCRSSSPLARISCSVAAFDSAPVASGEGGERERESTATSVVHRTLRERERERVTRHPGPETAPAPRATEHPEATVATATGAIGGVGLGLPGLLWTFS